MTFNIYACTACTVVNLLLVAAANMLTVKAGTCIGLKVAGVKVYPRQYRNITTHAVSACQNCVMSRADYFVEIVV